MNELLLAHIIMGVSALLPSFLLKVMNPTGRKGPRGYNTPFAQKTPETRAFSVKYATVGMFWVGLGIIMVQVVSYFLIGGEASILITAGAMTFGFLGVVVATEMKLHARFDKDGKPKDLFPRY